MNFREYPDRDMLAIDLANVLAGEIETCLLTHDQVSFVVPGGTTPGPIFDVLCAADIDWSRVHIMPSDERWVEPDDPRSNARQIRDRLLVNRAAMAQLVPLYADAEQPEDVLGAIAASLEPHLPISVLLLGMGDDMHTASLFPGVDGLATALDSQAGTLGIMRPESVPEARVTLTAQVLDGALSKHLVIFGTDKRAALDRATSLPPEQAPVNAVLSGMTVHWAK
ncbi:MAG: 6-phosphogluconolactonase [Rhodobacteraceae bacterium]|nr:6-phosphogluconolactonase [Paracoccaceae bacterium]